MALYNLGGTFNICVKRQNGSKILNFCRTARYFAEGFCGKVELNIQKKLSFCLRSNV